MRHPPTLQTQFARSSPHVLQANLKAKPVLLSLIVYAQSSPFANQASMKLLVRRTLQTVSAGPYHNVQQINTRKASSQMGFQFASRSPNVAKTNTKAHLPHSLQIERAVRCLFALRVSGSPRHQLHFRIESANRLLFATRSIAIRLWNLPNILTQAVLHCQHAPADKHGCRFLQLTPAIVSAKN